MENQIKKGGGCGAIHVVIAENQDFFALKDGLTESFNGFGHIRH